jgi:DNA invertase Pin-like site-specific DNA recombinase
VPGRREIALQRGLEKVCLRHCLTLPDFHRGIRPTGERDVLSSPRLLHFQPIHCAARSGFIPDIVGTELQDVLVGNIFGIRFGNLTIPSSLVLVEIRRGSPGRPGESVQAYAKRAGYTIVTWFDDPAVTGDDMIDMRPGFAAALEQIAGNGVRTIIVETANRFARDLIVQETGYRRLHADGINLIAADKPDQFVDDTPTAVLVRQILGAVAQFDKAMTVAKLRGARERKRRKTGGKVEGRKSLAEKRPEAVALARSLSEQRPRLSLREISAKLATQSFTTPRGVPYSASAVASMLAAQKSSV